jgi:hypothetical protein
LLSYVVIKAIGYKAKPGRAASKALDSLLFVLCERPEKREEERSDGKTTSNERSKSKGRGHLGSTLTTAQYRYYSQQAAASEHPQAGSDRTPPHLREGLNPNQLTN